jgi:hypothetical protein
MLCGLKRGIRTSIQKVLGGTDRRRWVDKSELSHDWDTRTRQMAALVEPGASVIEFGAGRLVLKSFLPESCFYTPSDLVNRGPGTIVCDLNGNKLPQFQTSFDVAVFSGVLEYVNDVPRLVRHLSGCVQTIIASYAVLEKNRDGRRRKGWVNDYSAAQFIALFENADFRYDRAEEWKSQMIYRFTKR